jgi:hypothetical protein
VGSALMGRHATAAGPVTTPRWFAALPRRVWTPLAGGEQMPAAWQRGNRLAEAVPPPPYFDNLGPRFLTAGWNGACVDPDGMEMMLALNGGHSARQENDAYALDLGSEAPGWRMIVESTPASDATSGAPLLSRSRVVDDAGRQYLAPMRVPGWTLDGPHPGIAFDDRDPDLSRIRRRPRTLHTCSHYHYSNGRVWFPIMNSWDRGTGDTSLVKLSLDVAGLRANPKLAKWRHADLGPWQYLGAIREQVSGGMDSYGFGVAALDRTTGKLWYVGQKSTSYWSMETRGSAAGSHTFYDDAPRSKDLSSSAGAIATGIRTDEGRATCLFVMLEQGSHRVWILDTGRAGRGDAWSVVEPVNASSLEWAHSLRKVAPDYAGHTAAYGMVYFEPGKCFLAYNCDQIPDRAAVRVLRIPLRSDGTWNPHGDWVWSESRLGGPGPDLNNPTARGIGGGGGSYTRFNSVPDFAGTGDALLLHLSHFDRPTWVCRLPADAFT